jgi:UDP-N-acetylmuramoyl-L-alanyl-D-glutamate--2,6-diaminopimelate ligase
MDQDPSEKSLYFINDRAKAIQFALSIAKKGDTIIATGKGHEKTMNYGDGEKKWSDQEAIKQIVSKKI